MRAGGLPGLCLKIESLCPRYRSGMPLFRAGETSGRGPEEGQPVMEHLDSPPLVHRRRRAGRPSKSEGPRVNYAELDQILVFGEVREGASGGVSYPSYRELAVRYGVAVSVIGEYARKNKCQARRKKAAARVRARIAEKRIELRAEAAVLRSEEHTSELQSPDHL